jgi:hypothetical protein
MPTSANPATPARSATLSRWPDFAALPISPVRSLVARPARFMFDMYEETSAVSRTPTVRSATDHLFRIVVPSRWASRLGCLVSSL